jgi:segregation and condensation protein B
MAKKPVRKQAPPKLGERPRDSEAQESPETGDERSIEALIEDLGSGDEEPVPRKRKNSRRGKQAETEAAEAELAPEAETEAAELAPEAEAEVAEPAAEDAEAIAEPVAEDDSRGVKLIDTLPIDIEDDLSQVEGEASPRLVSIVESLLFASAKPLRVKQIRKVLEEPSVRQIQLALKHLIAHNDSRGVVVAQVAGGFVLQTHPQNATWVQRLLQAKPVRLSRPQLETLAVIAYRQPVTRPEIDHIRGVDSGAVIKLLLERELIQIVGKRDEPGRPMVYGTTVAFLEFFNLMSLRDLPDLREFRELSDDTKATLRKRMADEEVEALGQEVLQFAREDGGEPVAEPVEPAEEVTADEPEEFAAALESLDGDFVIEEQVDVDEPADGREPGEDEESEEVDDEEEGEADEEDEEEEDEEDEEEEDEEDEEEEDEEDEEEEDEEDEEEEDEEDEDDEEEDEDNEEEGEEEGEDDEEEEDDAEEEDDEEEA